ncbi:hypothetical protein ABE527_04940 [Brucella sp. TWI432]
MSNLSSPILSKASSISTDVRIDQVNALAATCRTLQQMGNVFEQRTVIWSKLIRKAMHIQFRIVMAIKTTCSDVFAILQTITKGRVNAKACHASLLSGGSYYTVNETETNHNFGGLIE